MALGPRELVVGSVDEPSGLPLPKAEFAVLFDASGPEPSPADGAMIERLATSNCREMVFAGKYAERFHDVADDVVEARGLLEIITTWLTNETADEIAFYFVTVSGGGPPVLVSLMPHEGTVERAIEERFSTPKVTGTDRWPA